MPGLDSELIRYAITKAQTKGYRQVKVKLGDDKFSAVLSSAPANEPEEEDAPEEAVAEVAAPKEKAISSPAVGYFKMSRELKVGEKVEEGEKVGEVVALGIANDVTAKDPGEVAELCVGEGDAVEFGQKIVVLRP